jgi:hypothetical protein
MSPSKPPAGRQAQDRTKGGQYQLAHFHPADVPSQKHPRAAPESEENPVGVGSVSLQPSFWPEDFSVLAKNGAIAMHYSKDLLRNGASGEVVAVDSYTTRGILMPTAGWRRGASYMHACRYSMLSPSNFAGSGSLPSHTRSSISSRSRFLVSGFFSRW